MKTRLILIMVCMMSLLASCTSNSPQDELRSMCERDNKTMPKDLGNTIIATSIEYADGNVVYHLTCNELACPLYNEEVVKEVTAEMEKQLKNSTESELIKLVSLCRQANADIVYEYRTVQGNTYRIVIPM